MTTMTEQDELGVYHVLRLHNRVREIYLNLPHSILHKCLVLMDGHFPILDRLNLVVDKIITTTFPSNAFLAPNLRHLVLSDISLPEGLQLLTRLITSTVSLVTLKLSGIQTFFHPTLLVACLSSLSQLEELFICLSISSPRPIAERELLREKGIPITLPNLKTFQFIGDTAYLESLVSRIRAPHLECLNLDIPLFNLFTLPHLSHFINIAVGFKPHTARVHFGRYTVCILMTYDNSPWSDGGFLLRVRRYRLDLQINCMAQIFTALTSALCCVEQLILVNHWLLRTDLFETSEVDSTTWYKLLRSFIGMKSLYVYDKLLDELYDALQVDQIGSDPGFLPDLQCIFAVDYLFTSFIDTRRVVGRPVQFSLLLSPPPLIPEPLVWWGTSKPIHCNNME